MSSLLASYMQKEITLPEFEQALKSIKSFSRDRELEIPPNRTVYECSNHVHGNLTMRRGVLGHNLTQNYDAQKITMSQVVDAAMDELVRLVRVNEPFWVKSPNTQDGYTLHRESYEQVFPKNNHFKGAYVCEESSKYSGLVKISGIDLVGMFLDSVSINYNLLLEKFKLMTKIDFLVALLSDIIRERFNVFIYNFSALIKSLLVLSTTSFINIL
jgi:homeobox-leucine zipper protein